MDESVVRAMARWPNVPDCYGWLALTRRGEWRIGAQRERIAHRGLTEFINRNYLAGEDGAWFFQNGPQRVWVSLDYMPLAYTLAHGVPLRLRAHTGKLAQRIERIMVDEDGSLLVVTDLGPGVLDDRDLSAALPLIRSTDGRSLEDALADPSAPLWFGPDRTSIERMAAEGMEAALRFTRRPEPPAPS